MYKKDKQGIIIVLIALTVLLGFAVAFQWQATIVAAAIGLTVVIVHILSEIHQRLRQLEQAAPSYFAQTSSITVQRIIVYSASLIALFAYANTWMWLAGGALLVLTLCLIHTISAFQTRLLHLEQYHQVQSKTETFTKTLPQFQNPDSLTQAPLPQSSLSASGSQSEQPAWMRADQPPVHDQTTQSSIDEMSSKQIEQPTWWRPAVDWMMHGNPILRVAVAVLMVGVVLLLRFASEHWQLSLGAKLGFIAAAGGITTFVGYILQKKNQLFAVALQGLGLAVVFLTLIFSHHFSVIASLTSASILFVILLSLTVYLSLKQQALYLALLALTMAYLAPLVIPQHHPDVVFLFSYYFLINLAVAVVNFIQPWKILHQIAFFATMLIGGAVIGIYADRQQFNTLDIILWLHIALFIWLSVRYSQLMLRAQKQHDDVKLDMPRLQPILDIGLIFSVPVLGFSLHAYLMHNSTQALTWGAVALALIYLGLNIWIKRQYPQLSILAKSFFILAVVFLALIFPLAKGAHWTSTGWVIQGTALIVWGVTERYRLSRYIGVALVLLSSVALIFQVWSTEQFPILSTMIYALAQFISAFYLLHYQDVEKYFSARMLSGIFVILGMYAGAIAGVEFMQWQQHGLSPYLAIATGLLVIYSLLVDYKGQVRWDRIQLILLAGLLFLLYAASFAANVYAVWHWPSALSQATFALAAVLLSLMLLRLKFSNSKVYTDIWSTLLWLSLAIIGLALFPAMPIVALAIVPLLYGLWSFSSKRMQLLQQLPVWCLTLFWLLLISLDPYSAEQYYFFPLLNFTDIFSLLMFAGLLWIIYHHDFSTERSIEWSFKVSTILMGLLVLSSVVVRAMHHYFNTPLWSVEIWLNGDVQLSLTLLWVILAFILMTFSSRRHLRQIWFVGAALLAIVVAKLLLLDLSQSGTLTRVISFIGSGAIMLVIAYLAPLPPALDQIEKES
ncbi:MULTISPECIES: DUF2339 domain-containing protein [Acinetobacter]|uniref:DUF2339 domain-containing protein n=1 Tax=Acinetobacter TaxID=469 RepID=UPI00019AE499|nr:MULTISPECIES: DUF2339 domain-containing protein [Acinetobacter]EEH67340.1 hypothetical protein HMPREF0023_3116 [Acinetobacter sp. ATCC 27244]ENW18085.1 hypothetical protein F926_03219 [Acinetobacter haemolyticus NIPH 261]NAR50461.1 DUF2339 domain-containing protein [Acinetobacter haemolyticus]NAR57047.1 DUF2339 domain-containing protein [Acinetobacter haemolyticus]NAR59386.1 DUF2339 domain-containing protein [Acinetobacter haemolyticus]